MAPGSVIQFVHKHMGLVPGWGGAARLVRIVGSQNALKLLGGAVKVDPKLGLDIGLADGVLQARQEAEGTDSPLQLAENWLSHYTKGPAPVIQAVKKVVLSGRELPLSEALRTEKDVFGMVWGGPANLQALASKSKHKWPVVSLTQIGCVLFKKPQKQRTVTNSLTRGWHHWPEWIKNRFYTFM